MQYKYSSHHGCRQNNLPIRHGPGTVRSTGVLNSSTEVSKVAPLPLVSSLKGCRFIYMELLETCVESRGPYAGG